ncbi:MAG: hypothetical protein ACJA1P_000220, partial [Maribacter sp.]
MLVLKLECKNIKVNKKFIYLFEIIIPLIQVVNP